VAQRERTIRDLQANLDQMHSRLLTGEAQLQQQLRQKQEELRASKLRMQQLAPLVQRIASRAAQ